MWASHPEIKRRDKQFISDDRRVITRLFLPGEPRRFQNIVQRILQLSPGQVENQLSEVMHNFNSRHRNLEEILEEHADQAIAQIDDPGRLSDSQRHLIGAYFTMEYSIESAALFNPSIVPHPDQNGVGPGSCRFIMSLRATGEGHISSIVFRTGLLESDGNIQFDPTSRMVGSAKPDRNATYDKYTFFLKLIEMGVYNDESGDMLANLPEEFYLGDLERATSAAMKSAEADDNTRETAENLIWLARSNYQLTFPSDCPISEVVIFPVTENESRGIEDARFVRFVDDDGSVIYYGTYTAYNGFRILPQLLRTDDFSRFQIITLNGQCVQNKGMALFPRKIDGRYHMIGRLDGENLHQMSSTNVRFWNEADILRGPQHPWEFVQIGNCGSPIETDRGWILLTHGVGPMRRYCIGAMLLDLDDPSRIIAASKEPLLTPNEKEREGYVPNVVYSCGAMVHNDVLFIPYAMADSATSMATISLQALFDHLLK